MQDNASSSGSWCERRTVLGVGLALAPWLAGVAQADDGAALPPQIGDQFVFLTGPQKGQPVKIDELTLGGPQVQVYPADPKTGMVRNGSRLNLMLLVRLDPATLSAETRERAADGVVAYTGVCTHQACPVNMWSAEKNAFVCSCHASVYDPKNGAEVLSGPAPRPLPTLSLKVENGMPVVASGFSARIGGMVG